MIGTHNWCSPSLQSNNGAFKSCFQKCSTISLRGRVIVSCLFKATLSIHSLHEKCCVWRWINVIDCGAMGRTNYCRTGIPSMHGCAPRITKELIPCCSSISRFFFSFVAYFCHYFFTLVFTLQYSHGPRWFAEEVAQVCRALCHLKMFSRSQKSGRRQWGQGVSMSLGCEHISTLTFLETSNLSTAQKLRLHVCPTLCDATFDPLTPSRTVKTHATHFLSSTQVFANRKTACALCTAQTRPLWLPTVKPCQHAMFTMD